MNDLPKIDLNRIFRLRDKLFGKVFEPLIGQEVVEDIFERLVRQTRQTISKPVEHNAAFESLRPLLGLHLTRLDAYRTCWRVAANAEQLEQGIPVLPWTCQRFNEWAPIEVLSVKRDRNNWGKSGWRYKLQFLAGEPTGLESSIFWEYRVAAMAAKCMGFSKWSSGSYRFTHAAQLVGLRFFGYIEAAKSTNSPYIYQFDATDSMREWNRKHVLRGRLRVSGGRCPNNFQHPCHVCAIGTDQCQFATHARTFYPDFCNHCQQDNQPFNPEDPTYCVSCTVKLRMQRDNGTVPQHASRAASAR